MKTKNHPILEDLWATKDALAREAGDDLVRICENTRRWAAAHPHRGPVINDAAELRQWLASQENAELVIIREDPPPGQWAMMKTD